MKSYFIALSGILFMVFSCANSSDSNEQIKNPEIISYSIYSDEIKDTFVIDVSLPKSYMVEPNKKYPVIYLTDGNWRTDQHGSIHSMAQKENIKEMIVVGIGYPSNYNFDYIRVRDLITNPGKFLDFILLKIIPRIDSTYRTNGERTLWGSSYGGFFAMYSLFNYLEKTQGVFKNYIVASAAALETTNFNGKKQNLFGLEDILFSKTKTLNENLYITVGGDEDVARFLNPFKEIVKVLGSRNYNGFYFKSFIDPGKNHYTVWEPTLYEGIRLFLKK